MVYFIVNNNYHLIDLKKHIEKLKGKHEISIIQIPHTLEIIKSSNDFKVFEYLPILGKKLNPIKYFNIIAKIKREIKPNSEDVLFIYTEFELLNLFFVTYFKEKNARVFLFEEGIATYLEMCYRHKDKVNIRRILLNKYLKFMLGMKHIRISNSNTLSPFFLKDSMYDGIMLYFDIELYRKIDKNIVKNSIKKIETLDSKKVIFLNEDIYNYFEDFETYLITLEKLMFKLSENFEYVYFKFHPREYRMPKIIEKISQILKKIKNIEIIDRVEPIELIIEEIKPKYVVSYACVALMNLYFMGLEPIYIYSAIENIKRKDDFIKTTEFLNLLNYNFINDFSEINENYESKINYNDKAGSSLITLLENKNHIVE